MARYIDADKMIQQLEKSIEFQEKYATFREVKQTKLFIESLKNEPTADVAEVKHGEWETVVVYNDTCIATCSSCRQPIVERGCNATAFKLENEFCRKCGAKMDGGKAE